MQPRIEKSIAHFLAKTLTPECGEIFKTLRAKRGSRGWDSPDFESIAPSVK
ncbi:hypothetical protein C8R34_1122 [Nitrosomonas sp. Nm84]|uniref:hypothetical protein n=1 Tax=Nitrosomonas sp. Nm84 TaxID=200124 RepID=UPI000D9077E0|nr:hypothetical protein [Nitrosomonas sp. Nm84]PXW86840.1 hypothetical protein C8R34_1122 [Nitrosomonas sp. Nm84]